MDAARQLNTGRGEAGSLAPSRPGARGGADFELIELMFFAYRDFTRDANRLLETFGLGRAHHRVLHFVTRRPGLSIAELLDILKITKQSLNRVLKDLLDRDYVAAVPGDKDRRRRRLYPGPRGEALIGDIARLQSRRFARVFDGLPEGARDDARAFLLAMIDPEEKDKVAGLIGSEAPRGEEAPAYGKDHDRRD